MGKRSTAKKRGSNNPGLRNVVRRSTSKTVDVEPTDLDPAVYKPKPEPTPYGANAKAVQLGRRHR